MNIQSIYLGVSANDYTGDPLRTGGFKINDNFFELFSYNSYRHRHALLVYRTLSSEPDYLTISGLDVNLVAPLIGVIGQPYEERGERNLPFVLTQDVNAAWSVSADSEAYLYIEKNSLSGTVVYGSSPYLPRVSETSGTPVSAGEHWYSVLENVMYEWDGADYIAVNRLFVAYVSATSAIDVFSYIVDNDESRALDYTLANLYLSATNYTDAALISALNYADTVSLSAYLSAKAYTDSVSANIPTIEQITAIADDSGKKWAIVLG